MHELSLCQALIDQVISIAREQRVSSVSDIYLRVGPLSGVEGPLLRNAFPIAAAGTVANDANLHLEDAPIRVRCEACGEESDAKTNNLVCAACGDWRTALISGDELILQRVVMGDAHV
jgi:hydrogenase nickel incorporation protein HypA/HybF